MDRSVRTGTESTVAENKQRYGFGEYGANRYGGPADIVVQYDTDDDGIDIGELGTAAADFARGEITIRSLASVARAFARQ